MAKVKKRRLSKVFLRMVYIFIVLFGLSYGSLFFYDGFYHGKKPTTTVLNYNINHNLDYKVNLKDNQFIDLEKQNSTSTYVTELVNDITTNFNYEYIMSKVGQITYEVEIVGNLIGEYQGSSDIKNPEVWNQKYEFLPKEKTTLNDVSVLRLNKELVIDFPTINDQVIAFKNQMKLPIQAYMDVKFNIKVVANVDGETVHESSTESLRIPYNQLAFSVTKNVPENRQGNLTYKLDYDKYNIKNFIIGGILISIGVITFIFKFNIIFNRKKRSKYESEIERILRSYGDVIITLVSPIIEDDLNVVHVSTFSELIDLEEELRIPINYYEVEHNYEAEFSIIHNNVIYKYVYKEDE